MRDILTIRGGCTLLLLAAIAGGATDPIGEFEASIKAGKYSEACTLLRSYVAEHPESWQAFYQLGYAEFRLHRVRESIGDLCKSILLKQDFAESHKILAYDLNILGRQDLAIRELEQAIRDDPVSLDSHYELGRVYYEQGLYKQAVEQLENAKTLAPESVRTYPNLGLAYSAVGENSKATEEFETGVRLNDAQKEPSAWPLIDYATYLNTQHRFGEARAMLAKAIAIDGQWDQEYDELAKAYRGLGQTGPAIEAMKQAIERNPHKSEYHYVLARLYTKTHQLAAAKEQLAQYQHPTKKDTE